MTKSKSQITSKEALKEAQSMNCSTFMEKYDSQIEWDEIENILNYDEGTVNIAFHGKDQTQYFLFVDGKLESASA